MGIKEDKEQQSLEIDAVFIRVIEKEIRPFVVSHGGDISFVSYDRDSRVVTVKLSGACVGCPIAFYTVKQGVLQTLQKSYPELIDVVSVS